MEYAEYRSKIRKRTRNFVFMADGSVWANYICEGVPIDHYTPGSLEAAAREHVSLVNHLMNIDAPETLLGGFLTRVSDQERLDAVVDGITGLVGADGTPSLNRTVEAYQAALKSGRYPRYRRLYWVSVRLGVGMSAASRAASAIWDTDPHANVNDSDLLAMDRVIRGKFPAAFGMRLAQPEDLDWVYDRMRLRGCRVPLPLPYRTRRPQVAPGPGGFPVITVDPNPDGEAIIRDFVERYDAGDPPGAKKSLIQHFRTLEHGNVIAVRNPDIRTPEMPDGMISYQSVFAVAGYADANDPSSRGFTALVDQATGLDGDFVFRLRPAQYHTSKDLEGTLKDLAAEQKANSTSSIDDEAYADRFHNIREFGREIRHDGASAKFEVTTIFAFGAPRLDALTKQIRTVTGALESAGYRTFTPTGLVEELWDMMWPCVSSTSLVSDLAGTTTSSLFAEYIPMRFHRVGDRRGIPVGQSIDDILGNDVFFDIHHATEEGNGSMAVTGAQGRGKSHLMKYIVSYMADMKLPAYILDGEGEWATFASTLPSAQVVDLANPTVSVDPLKIMPVEEACPIIADLFLPLLGVNPDTAEGVRLAGFFDAAWVRSRGYTTTRQVLEGIVSPSMKTSDLADAIAGIERLLRNRLADAFIDPVINGRVEELPAAEITADTVVFYTKGIALPPAGKTEERMSLRERFGLMANSAVALLTKHFFDKTPGVAAFVLDEASFFDGLDVLSQMIEEPDRKGRKNKKLVIVGSQTGEELSKPEYKLIRRKFCFGQDTTANAVEALTWADFVASPGLVTNLVSDTSPLRHDRNNRPQRGRAGEAFLNDGAARGKIRVFDQMRSDRRAISDTTASRYIRYEGTAAHADADAAGVVAG